MSVGSTIHLEDAHMDEAWRCHQRLNGVVLPKVRAAIAREYADWLALAAYDHAARVRTLRRPDDEEDGDASAPEAPLSARPRRNGTVSPTA
jgi:hypothetical protein